jgi:hypothetical protein
MKTTSVACLLPAVAFATIAHATTWGEPERVADPVRSDSQCLVESPASWGGYIYQLPSKYDQVFWPLTDPKGLWFCSKSGFTAFIGDFELTPKEKTAVAAELATFYKPINKPTLRQKLVLLEKSYTARDQNTRGKIKLLRVLAYYHETDLKDFDGAAALRRKALELIDSALSTERDPACRMQYLFVAAVYHRELGDLEKSDASAKLLKQALHQHKDNQDEEVAGMVEYLTELSRDIDRIVPGGPLAPEFLQ